MHTARQVVSRDHAILTGKTARLSIGRDDLVYLSAIADLERGRIDAILRMKADGSDRTVVETPRPLWGLRNVTANVDGVMARCDSHHSPKVTVLARDFSEEGTVPYTRLEPNWRNPMKVEASDRPDKSFYMLNRILQDTAPVETTKLRLRLPVPPTDVPRLAEIVVHGQAL